MFVFRHKQTELQGLKEYLKIRKKQKAKQRSVRECKPFQCSSQTLYRIYMVYSQAGYSWLFADNSGTAWDRYIKTIYIYIYILWIWCDESNHFVFWVDCVEVSGKQKRKQELVQRIWVCSWGKLNTVPLNYKKKLWYTNLESWTEVEQKSNNVAGPWWSFRLGIANFAGEFNSRQGFGSTSISDRSKIDSLLKVNCCSLMCHYFYTCIWFFHSCYVL